jgi:hypothetical protein
MRALMTPRTGRAAVMPGRSRACRLRWQRHHTLSLHMMTVGWSAACLNSSPSAVRPVADGEQQAGRESVAHSDEEGAR